MEDILPYLDQICGKILQHLLFRKGARGVYGINLLMNRTSEVYNCLAFDMIHINPCKGIMLTLFGQDKIFDLKVLNKIKNTIYNV